MINVKLFVTLVLIIAGANTSEYCKICPNHTLCKYPIPGPSRACMGYDPSALLTPDDTISLVNRINQRRNFIALGLSKRLPTAANMKKMSWSEDLAWSAQRWVDQCDSALFPDHHDQCRNLEDKLVGQSIATIVGPSPGLSVKSFVDIWFMQTLDYSGFVSYYNHSHDFKTKDFTQLVWAETDSVGCGKARFQIRYEMVIERLVCNFAPAGNTKRKPVYAIGPPATQCGSGPDDTYSGLCKHPTRSRKLTFASQPLTSLLRIFNFPNSSLKEEINPLENNNKQSNTNNETDDHRHQKSRHVVNNSQVNFSRFIPPPLQWNNFSESKNYLMHHYQPESGQYRMYHGLNHQENIIPPYTSTTEPSFRRFDLLTSFSIPLPNTSGNARKCNQFNQCTRRLPAVVNCNSLVPCVHDKCTRGQNSGCAVTPPYIYKVQTSHVCPHSQCPCSSITTCLPSTTRYPCYEVTCRCPCHIAATSACCSKILRVEDPTAKDETRKSGELHYYDLFPNVAMRSGETNKTLLNKSSNRTDRKMWLLSHLPHNEKHQVQHKRREYPILNNYDQLQHEPKTPNNMDEGRDYLHSYFDSRKRQKRKPEEKVSYMSFWQKNENDKRNPLILKSLQYTTLFNKKHRNTWRTTHFTKTDKTVTESITIELKNDEHEDYIEYTQHSSEKYLSFDELMHLRKINSGEVYARRNVKGKSSNKTMEKINKSIKNDSKHSSTTKNINKSNIITKNDNKKTNSSNSPSTTSTTFKTSSKTVAKPTTNTTHTKYTINTQFQRKKYCTRRLTCTWTAFTATAGDGSIINPGAGGGSGGSRTPPGYVEGCTRTSTCTRDYMNRNKISTLPMSTFGPGQETLEDEDYCERRSLNVHRRNSNEEAKEIFKFQKFYSNLTANFVFADQISTSKGQTAKSENICNCEEEDTRVKRNAINTLQCYNCDPKQGHYKNPRMSYGDLYYLVLTKLTKSWEYKKNIKTVEKCPCSNGSSLQRHIMSVFLSFWCSYR